MPFAYYARLTRAQQAIYRRSDEIPEVRLPEPARLHAAVATLTTALASEDRAAVQHATERMIRGLTDALGVPPVRVEVLAARPHAKWGELHGLYTAERGRTPKIQLWMRTAKQRRVVAFRTYLRTLLHEVGHHLDYALLRLRDSYHTEGFYKRESSLFKQLVPESRAPVASIQGWFEKPADERMARLARTPDQVAAALGGHRAAVLARRPAPEAWSPTEIVCHLRDIEEVLGERVAAILADDEPALPEAGPADRWARERQYARHDPEQALAHFRRRRGESLETLIALPPAGWQRGGEHPARGRLTIDMLVAHMAWHDDNHLEQLIRALEGRP
ncbi:MAG TPA: DinB family protein [Candidatus Binatia bacterium]|nr:DinB family protein [Candidatus Binatia bacterium]